MTPGLCFPLQLTLLLTHRGMARLSCSGWLVRCRDDPSTNWDCLKVTSLIETTTVHHRDAKPPHHSTMLVVHFIVKIISKYCTVVWLPDYFLTFVAFQNTEIINTIFLTYFRILKIGRRSKLLSVVLEGLSKWVDVFITINYFTTFRFCLIGLFSKDYCSLERVPHRSSKDELMGDFCPSNHPANSVKALEEAVRVIILCWDGAVQLHEMDWICLIARCCRK